MVTIKAKSNLHIKYLEKSNQYQIALNYKKINNTLEYLAKTNIIFSTYNISKNINGFIKLHDNLYIRISIIHKLGALVSFNKKMENIKGLRMKAGRESSFIDWTIDQNQIFKSSKKIIERKDEFRCEDLKEYYFDISIASDKDSIVMKHRPSDEVALLIGKDVAMSDRNKYLISPNSDGSRNRREYFAGSGSNIGRKY